MQLSAYKRICLLLMSSVTFSVVLLASPVERRSPGIDLSQDKVLYAIGYAHLDSQWNWTYQDTINQYLKDTLEQNFRNFERFPGYTFNFTGSSRYQLMKEYYPEEFERVKDYVRQERWFVSGSSVDEGDVNVPSPESIFRQILYGNQYFRQEFNKESYDFMLPDCFGFPAGMPSIWAHAGLLGFSTQKLTWGSAVGIPFNVGMWEGPDGKSVVAALNPGDYVGGVTAPLNNDSKWVNRINDSGKKYGVFADYHYYGVGDQGGAPRPHDVENVVRSLGTDGKIRVLAAASDQLYIDLNESDKGRLPRYRGDLLLTEHSSGTLTSQAYMKRWNRQNEQLADAAERAASTAFWLKAAAYPTGKLYDSWHRVLVSQMHDILPGTSLPKAYEFSQNDEIIALNGFSAVLTGSVGAVARALDTNTQGRAIVVYNALSVGRRDIVKAELKYQEMPAGIRILDDNGQEVPVQITAKKNQLISFIFLADLPPVGYAVYDVITSNEANEEYDSNLKISANSLENDEYAVTLNQAGDVASIYDKTNQKELLAAPARIEFLHENPSEYPAWNMDWKDRQEPPYAYVDGPATVRILEKGPVRVSLEVVRKAQGSVFTQQVSLVQGARQVEFHTAIDWLSQKSSLKASFPLTVANSVARYNMGMGSIERNNNHAKKYEVPSQQWFDLTDRNGQYGVTIIEDSKFGSDKPSDNTLRLTLLYTPGTRGGFHYQSTQDWGRHDFTYGIYGHAGDWRKAQSEWQGARMNQPLMAFESPKHDGFLGRRFSMLEVNNPQVAVRALKKAEDSDYLIVRLQEIWGQPAENTTLTFAAPVVDAYETDAQERPIGEARIENGRLVADLTSFSPKTYAVRLAIPAEVLEPIKSKPIALAFNSDVISSDTNKNDGGFSNARSGSYPAEMLPEEITSEGIRFVMGPSQDGQKNSLITQGQTITLPQGSYNRLYFLAAATSDTVGTFQVDDNPVDIKIQKWFGFVGMYDLRLWANNWNVSSIVPGFIKRNNIAWFSTHRHVAGKNDAYVFSYIFKYGIDIPVGAQSITLPKNAMIRILAMTVANDDNGRTIPVADLYDNFDGRTLVQPRSAKVPLYEFGEPIGAAEIERAERFEDLLLGMPSSRDFADRSSGNNVVVNYLAARPHSKSGAVGKKLVRLNDGDYARHDDDVKRCIWYDNVEGRFYMDLGASIDVEKIKVYSWHKSNRAPQNFILIGTNRHDANLESPQQGDWKLLAKVNTNDLGEGGVHVSSITAHSGNLGKFRYLMWISENVGEGTFFTEIDVNP